MSVVGLSFALYLIGYCLTLTFLGYKANQQDHRLYYFPLCSILRTALLWPFCLMVFICHHIEIFIYRRS